MHPGPYRAPGKVEPDPSGLEQLLAWARVRKGVRPVQRTEASLPTYQRTAFLRHLALIPIVLIALCVESGVALLLVGAPQGPGSVEPFCRDVRVGTPDRLARARARGRGFSIITPGAVTGFVVRGRTANFFPDFCVVNVSAGVVTSSKYNEP